MESNSMLKSNRNIVEEPAKEQGMWIFCRYWVSGKQEGHLHMEFIVSSITRQGVPNIIAGWCEHFTEQGSIHEYH